MNLEKKLLRITNIIFEKGKVPSDFTKAIIEPLYKKDDKNEFGNYRGISLVFGGSKLLSMMIFFRLIDVVDKFWREETVWS